MKHFVAYGGRDKTHADTIAAASIAASTNEVSYVPWALEDRSGSTVAKAVEDWLDDAEGLVADLTYVNDNVTYELGYAIGAGKDIRLIRNYSVPIDDLKQIGLLDTLLRDEFKTRHDLEERLKNRPAPKNKWINSPANVRQPIYVLAPPSATQFSTRLFSAIKKKARFKFRSFKAWEIGRLTAQEAWEQVSASYGVIVTWAPGTDLDARRNNQRAALIFGMACGLNVPALLVAHEKADLPSDLQTLATRFMSDTELADICEEFRDQVHDAINSCQLEQRLPYLLLDGIHCGDPAAENEQDHLKNYFLETEEFKQTLRGDVNLVVGRKGSGKSAIFLQVRDRIRANKNNIVVDLNPDGYQLIKFKEIIVQLQQLGTRKEFIEAFWEYVLWLEIAYKILEKDARVAMRDSSLAQRYDRLKSLFIARVDTGTGDFSERLRLLTDMISDRFQEKVAQSNLGDIRSSKVLEVIYGTDIAQIRDEILSYLKLKGTVLFLFDNLDRMRTSAGFDEDDALLILGLVESMQAISKNFRRNKFDFNWVVFIRSDVYHFVVNKMADYGKHNLRSLDWSDREVLKRLLQRRIESSVNDDSQTWDQLWGSISVPTVRDQDVFDFIIDASLMRPRYIIKIFESAKRRAINMGHQKIEEADYEAALEELGWTVSEDLNLELRDIIQSAAPLLYDIGQLEGACGLPELRDAIAKRVGATDLVERVIDVLLWGGAIGISPDSGTSTHIYDCGYKLSFLRSLIDCNPHLEIRLHPTLSNVITKNVHSRAEAA